MTSIPKPRHAADAIADDERSVSEVVGVALLIGIVVIGMATILYVGTSEIGEGREGVEVDQAEQGLTEFDSAAGRVATGSTSSQEVDLGLRVNRGTLDVEQNTGNITVRYFDPFDPLNGTEVMNTSMGTVVYESDDTTVGYQGGGVWRSDGNSSTMVSPPKITNRERTLNLPIVKTKKGGSVHSRVRISSIESKQQFPDSTRDNLSNKVESGILEITIESRYYKAWGQFFEDETNANVVPAESPNTIIVVFYGSGYDFGEDAGIIATSGPGEIRMEGSGAYIDSYNSSVGPYSETKDEEGIVKSAGPIDMYGDSVIDGDAESNDQILLNGNASITGDACANEGVEGEDQVEGDYNCSANVPELGPLDRPVEIALDNLSESNDNDEADAIEDERLNFSDVGHGQTEGEVLELDPGEYYLEKIEMEANETLVLDAKNGDITIGVRDYVILDEGNFEITGNESDGNVTMYIGSEASSGITVAGSGNEPADHFYVDGDSSVDVYNDTSTRFQILAPSHFTGAIRGSSSVDPQVTGVILAPTPGDGPSQFIVRDGELFGAIVTGNLSVENNAEVHFDRGIIGSGIPFGDESLIDYLYVGEHEIEVRD